MWFSSQSCLEEQERGWDTVVHSVETDSRYRVLMQISLAITFWLEWPEEKMDLHLREKEMRSEARKEHNREESHSELGS